MIKRLTYLFFLISTCSFAQIRGAVVVAAESGVSAGFEYPALERIADIQRGCRYSSCRYGHAISYRLFCCSRRKRSLSSGA